MTGDEDPHDFLRTAVAIGNKLSESALWTGDACTWEGLKPVMVNGSSKKLVRPLGTDLYTGSAGCALFLSQLQQVAPSNLIEHTLRGAIAGSLLHMQEIDAGLRMSFYCGWGGIAFATFHAADVLEDAALADRALTILKTLSTQKLTRDTPHDVLIGVAGIIPALLALHAKTGKAWLLRFAVRLGERLLDRARRREIGWSWQPDGALNHLHRDDLTGYAHGASGIATALAELWKATGDARFLEGAHQGFRYERHWFRESVDNWVDLRYVPDFDGAAPSSARETFQVQWCHGAAGIALARLRAWQLIGDDILRQEAVRALQTVTSDLLLYPRNWQPNFSLCHGVAGNCTALLVGARCLQQNEWLEVARRMGRQGIEEFLRTGAEWPSSLGAGEIPGLMTGVAGTGLFYLQLANPAIDPITLVRGL